MRRARNILPMTWLVIVMMLAFGPMHSLLHGRMEAIDAIFGNASGNYSTVCLAQDNGSHGFTLHDADDCPFCNGSLTLFSMQESAGIKWRVLLTACHFVPLFYSRASYRLFDGRAPPRS